MVERQQYRGFLSEIKSFFLTMKEIGFSLGHIVIVLVGIMTSITLIVVSQNLGKTEYQSGILDTVRIISYSLDESIKNNRIHMSMMESGIRGIERDLKDHIIYTEAGNAALGFDPYIRSGQTNMLLSSNGEKNYLLEEPDLDLLFDAKQ